MRTIQVLWSGNMETCSREVNILTADCRLHCTALHNLNSSWSTTVSTTYRERDSVGTPYSEYKQGERKSVQVQTQPDGHEPKPLDESAVADLSLQTL
jgi:hypothetical protein